MASLNVVLPSLGRDTRASQTQALLASAGAALAAALAVTVLLARGPERQQRRARPGWATDAARSRTGLLVR
jgi:hypothetical protein